MTMIATFLLAYVLSGIYGVVLDYRMPTVDRPAYIRRGSVTLLIGAVLLWLPMLVLSLALTKRAQAKDIGLFVLFIALSAAGQFLLAQLA